MGREVHAWMVLLRTAPCVCVAVTHRASWEAAAKLMDAKERAREEGEKGSEAALARPSGRQVPVLQHSRSEGRWMSMQ